MSDQTNPKGLLATFNEMTGKGKATWASLAFLFMVAGASLQWVGSAVDWWRAPAIRDSRLDVLEETATEVPPIKAEIIILRELIEAGNDQRNVIVKSVEQLKDGQFRLTVQVERLDERTGQGNR